MRYLPFIVLAILVASGCARSDESVLARVGDDVITAEEFLLNYEFGHGHLRSGDDPKRDYLQYLIYESLLAQEAAKRNLDTLPAIRHAMHTLQEELLIERVFEEKVLAGIEVSDEEIRAEINKDAVSFQFRLLPTGTKTEGERLRQIMLESSFEEVMQQQLDRIPELRQVEGDLTSPYVKADELDPAVMEILRDLPINVPSQPAFYEGGWYLFEVTDVRRQRLSEEDYTLKAPSYHKIVYNRKAMELGSAFIAETMEPLGVRTKREGFDILDKALFDWYSEVTPERNLLHYIEEQGVRTHYIESLIVNYEAPLVQYRDADWTIYDFLEHFTPGRYVIRPDDPASFRARLADIVALVVRDAVLLDIADRENLYQNDAYERSLALWESKWLFQEYRNLLLEDRAPGAAVPALEQHAESLMSRYDVKVNWAMLDTLKTNISRANPTMTVHLFKNNANKMPFPIADPNWRAE